MHRLARYSAVALAAFALAATAAYGVIVFLIPGFESMALLPLLTGALFIPLCTFLAVVERKIRQRAG